MSEESAAETLERTTTKAHASIVAAVSTLESCLSVLSAGVRGELEKAAMAEVDDRPSEQGQEGIPGAEQAAPGQQARRGGYDPDDVRELAWMTHQMIGLYQALRGIEEPSEARPESARGKRSPDTLASMFGGRK